MPNWYSKSLGDGVSAPIYTAEIEQFFLRLFEAAGQPVEMAVFTRNEPGSSHCEVMAYFSPEAASVALAVSALACQPPARHNLELLAGSPACWDVLFRE